ncbi:GTP pyrophosphokinase [Blastococcus sp. SYSU DS0619]
MGAVADAWLAKYRSQFHHYEEAAELARQQIVDATSGRPLSIQLITARAKNPDAAAEKIKRRGYGRPAQLMDDIIGVRIITLYEHSVADVARRLRSRFEVDEARSGDKAKELGLREVGYRSNHLVIRVRRTGLAPVSAILERTRIEVQVRSVIAHAWAEIEHSLRYKVGVGVPEELLRRFDALAGTLELVDREFSSIEAATVDVVNRLKGRYAGGEAHDDELSTVQLLACVSAARADMRPLGPHKLALEIEEAFRLAKVLKLAGVCTVGQLVQEIASGEVQSVIRKYAALDPANFEPEEASARVVLGAVIGLRSSALLQSSGAQDGRLVAALQ